MPIVKACLISSINSQFYHRVFIIFLALYKGPLSHFRCLVLHNVLYIVQILNKIWRNRQNYHKTDKAGSPCNLIVYTYSFK